MSTVETSVVLVMNTNDYEKQKENISKLRKEAMQVYEEDVIPRITLDKVKLPQHIVDILNTHHSQRYAFGGMRLKWLLLKSKEVAEWVDLEPGNLINLAKAVELQEYEAE